jgi:KaiC/GvpD/RAD55 family RecA-like ATPase
MIVYHKSQIGELNRSVFHRYPAETFFGGNDMPTQDPDSNILRDCLTKNAGDSPRLNLAQQFANIESLAHEKWVSALGQDRGSHSGAVHLRGVEQQVCHLLSLVHEIKLTSTEVFILLCSIIFHDLGRAVGDQGEELAKNSSGQHNPLVKILKSLGGDAKHHAIISALFLLKNEKEFGFRDREVARCVAIICASHDLGTARQLKESGFLEDVVLDQYGCIRIGWLACLLALADELDGSYHRATEDWVRYSPDVHTIKKEIVVCLSSTETNNEQCPVKEVIRDSNVKGRSRAQIRGCEVVLGGKLLVLHTHTCFFSGLSRRDESTTSATESNAGKDNSEFAYSIWRDMATKYVLLKFWRSQLKQMHLELLNVASNYNGHLFGLRTGETHQKKIIAEKRALKAEETYQILSNTEAAKCALTIEVQGEISDSLAIELEMFDVLIFENSGLICIKHDKHIEACIAILENEYRQVAEKPERNAAIPLTISNFRLALEPIIRQMKVDRILESAILLKFYSFGKSDFPWETLATEAGIERVEEVKIIFHRLLMLAKLLYQKGSNSGAFKPFFEKSFKSKSHIIKFVELDGEWSIRVDAINSNVPNDSIIAHDKAKGALGLFYQYVTKLLSGDNAGSENGNTENKPATARKKADDGHELVYRIMNEELAYLLDENQDRGIVLPQSQSPIYSRGGGPNIGINMVITGPPGVGKSTLAMDMISQGKLVEKKTPGKKSDEKEFMNVCAYYSLEQSLESIKELATGMGIDNDKIIDFYPDPSEGDDDLGEPGYVYLYRKILQEKLNPEGPLLFVPKLAPRSSGQSVSEESLYWFRYKQIARLLEANRAVKEYNKDDKPIRISTVVLDNLNAFCHHPLARRRVHQLFKLICWAGVLGIHIIEDNPAEEFRVFTTEVEALADIIIRLDWHEGEYRFKRIEVAKSRCQKNVLGIHPFKLRRLTPGEARKTSGFSEGKEDEEKILKLGKKGLPGFQVFPSVHSQVVRIEQRRKSFKNNDQGEATGGEAPSRFRFAADDDLCKLVERPGKTEDTGIPSDAFILLQGKSGGHKLAIAMNYIHGKSGEANGQNKTANRESTLVLNMGQHIKYDAVAGYPKWRRKSESNQNKEQALIWEKQKVDIDIYSTGEFNFSEGGIVQPSTEVGTRFIMNFHPGFLLPEEFIHIILMFLEQAKSYYVNSNIRISRVLFHSTAQLPPRFPLLDRDRLVLTTLVRLLKDQGISLMINAVEGVGRDELIKGLSAMADLKVTIYDFPDERLPRPYRDLIEAFALKQDSIVRMISSDNVTGKDYSKRYRLLYVDQGKTKPVLRIMDPKDLSTRSKPFYASWIRRTY